MDHKRGSFSGKIGFVLSAAGASVGLGNIWRFPYLAAKYGGAIFLLVYIILAMTFGYTMIIAETSIGRMTGKSPVGAYKSFSDKPALRVGGWINAIIPILIVPYYSVIGGWVIKYLAEYLMGKAHLVAEDGYFSSFISNGVSSELCFLVFTAMTLAIIFAGVENGIERVSKIMMPILVVLSLIIAVYSVTRPGALEGVKYFLVPNLDNFSWMTVVSAMGQMFYSLSIAMGILITFGSYMKKDVPIESSTRNGEVFDTAIAIMAGLMIIPAVFAFSGGDPGALEGVKYFLVPNLAHFSWMTVVTAMGQMFYSLSIAMGILITFGSYMKKDISIEGSTRNVEVFDTAIAIMAGLMIIPAVFAFSGGDPDALKAGPSLMFVTIPKVFDSMGLGTLIGIAFFLLVLFAALTSSIALTESAVSTLQDELHWSRRKSMSIMGVSMVLLGSLSSLGYGPLANVTVIGMQFLDFFDFLTNSVMMPIAAIASCILVSRVIGVDRIADEVTLNGAPFRRRKVFNAMIRFLCPFFAAIILISSIASAFGWISM